jgi:hypothetical protein
MNRGQKWTEKKRRAVFLTSALIVGVLGGLGAMVIPSVAQTLSVPPSPQSQAPQNPQAGPQPVLPSGGTASTVSPGTTTSLPPAPTPGPSPFSSAGRGLPGMPGGPPINGPMGAGARDPAASYMRPPVVGPLSCDPVVDPACL